MPFKVGEWLHPLSEMKGIIRLPMGKKDSTIDIISWMLELGIGGNDLLAYALVYSFSKDGVSKFRGSYEYIAWWLQCERRTAVNVINRLIDAGLIAKELRNEDGVKKHYLYALVPDEGKFFTSSEKNAKSSEKNSPAGSEKFSPNNSIRDISKDSSIRERNTKERNFNFRNSLINAGASAEVADQWLEVRAAKKLVNTELALADTLKEIRKAGLTVDAALRECVIRSWGGFKAEWLEREQNGGSRGARPEPKSNMQVIWERLQARENGTYNPNDDLPDLPDEQ